MILLQISLFLFSFDYVFAEFSQRIVGGEAADEDDAPFIVSLRVKGRHNCGGSLISESWILTAAHCALYPPNLFSIQYGVLKISRANDDSVIGIDKVIIHEDFDTFDLEHDIAVMHLERPIKFNGNVKLACLPKLNEHISDGTDAMVVGWGRLATGAAIPKNLQKANVNIVSNNYCKKVHALINTVFETNLCAWVPQGGIGQCNGDSGGPLIIDGKVVGLVSWSVKPCARKGFPGVYTRVASYRDWIRQKTDI